MFGDNPHGFHAYSSERALALLINDLGSISLIEPVFKRQLITQAENAKEICLTLQKIKPMNIITRDHELFSMLEATLEKIIESLKLIEKEHPWVEVKYRLPLLLSIGSFIDELTKQENSAKNTGPRCLVM